MSRARLFLLAAVLYIVLIAIAFWVPMNLRDVQPSFFLFLISACLFLFGVLSLRRSGWLWQIEALFWKLRTGKDLQWDNWKHEQDIRGKISIAFGIIWLLITLLMLSPEIQHVWVSLFHR